jgi:pimeloyl-ACP methyl ester carboxylesterase
MSTYVLIHGSWHGAWCWRKVTPLLESAGHRVVAPDLPGHGDDRTPFAQVTLDSYAQRIGDVVADQSGPVILVGHSMGGGAITQAAHRCPEGLSMLVYLAAYLPASGVSIAEQALEDFGSLIHSHIIIDPVRETAEVDSEALRDGFYADCSNDDFSFARERLRLDPLGPLTSPIGLPDLPDASGSNPPDLPKRGDSGLPRVYIECRKDRVLTPELQQRIQAQFPFARTYSLDTSHSPFFSAPEELVRHLLDCARLAV